MTARFEKHNDTKLLLAVAALVVGGAVGLTLIVGLRGENRVPSEVAGSRAVANEPALALRTTTATGAAGAETKLTGSTVDLEILRQAERIEAPAAADGDPGIDPRLDVEQEGFRAWQAREYDRSVAYFAAAATAEPESAYTWYMLALSRWKAGDLDGAVEAMERSVDRNDASIRTFVNLARIHNDRGSHEAALQAAERALQIDDGSILALYQQARSLYNLGRVDEAVAILERCTEQSRDYGHAFNLLGLIRLQRGDGAAAVEALQQAAADEPELAYVHNNLGLALERSGRLPEAVAAFRRAAEIGGNARAEVNLARVEPLLPAAEPQPIEAVAEFQPAPEAGTETNSARTESDLPPVASVTAGEGAAD